VTFAAADWAAVVGYLLITLILGLYFRSRSGKSTEDYFVSGRNVSWWLAGTSMVATTFAADTPLVVTGLVYRNGIAGNWFWWSFLPSGMMTVFLFARLWRRSGLLTDVQFAEMRYAGKPAAFLRGFRALYLGLLMNCLILGWVTKAMTAIVAISLGVSESTSKWICVLVLIPFTGLYVTLGGLWGVLWTDLFQFVLKMAIVIGIAWYAVGALGGMHAMLAKLHAMTVAAGPAASDPTKFFPDFSRPFTFQAMWALPVITFAVFLGVQWWAFWYPGAEPGGGGYIAQRIFSARDERNGLLSVLWYNVAHYALRPWPWILAALAVIVLYPGLAQPEPAYMRIVADHVPHALRGLVFAGFLAAFMSTVATQLNWGASYLVADFYRRFVKRGGTEQHYVVMSRVATVLLVIISAYVAAQLGSIVAGWEIVLTIGAGTGGVYLLRWYWWRINAWSEIAAMATAIAVTAILAWTKPFSGDTVVLFAKTSLATTAATSLVWIVVTFLTKPEREDVLVKFYRHVRPYIAGWKPVAQLAQDVPQTRDLGRNLLSWALGCGMVYLALFGSGKILLGNLGLGFVLLVFAAICAALLSRLMPRAKEWSA
jgi:solute:Na+ symporter, SSS family